MRSIDDPRVPAAPPATVFDRAGMRLSPPWFLLAVLCGFGVSCALGWAAAGSPRYASFVRFHEFISAETLYQPTALQVQRMVLDAPRTKVLVIVGGSSRSYGVGQRPTAVWTAALQQQLGERYHVINLALRAGGVDQLGMNAVEMALHDGRRAIYAAHALHPGDGWNDGSPHYRYFRFEAAAEGLLLPWEPRQRAVAVMPHGIPRADAGHLEEMQLRGALNHYARFADLWTLVGYDYAFLPSWSHFTRRAPFRARRHFSDFEETVQSGGYHLFPFAQAMSYARRQAIPISAEQAALLRARYALMPLEVRRRTIVFPGEASPYYTRNLAAAEQASVRAVVRDIGAFAAEAGITVVATEEDWTIDDYVDIVHLSERGGRRLAGIIAPAVAAMSARLGYLE